MLELQQVGRAKPPARLATGQAQDLPLGIQFSKLNEPGRSVTEYPWASPDKRYQLDLIKLFRILFSTLNTVPCLVPLGKLRLSEIFIQFSKS